MSVASRPMPIMGMTTDFMLPRVAAPFEWVDTPSGPAMVCGALVPIAPHLFTTRSWLLGSPDCDPAGGWAQVAQALGVDDAHLGRLRQVHGTTTVVARAAAGAQQPEGDIIMSDGG